MSKKINVGNAKWQALSSKKNTTTDEERRKNYTLQGLENLAVAVVKSAIDEYRESGFKIKRLKYQVSIGKRKNDSKLKKAIRECEDAMRINLLFFKSDKFKALCTLNPEWTIKTLNKQIEEFDPSQEEKKEQKEVEEK